MSASAVSRHELGRGGQVSNGAGAGVEHCFEDASLASGEQGIVVITTDLVAVGAGEYEVAFAGSTSGLRAASGFPRQERRVPQNPMLRQPTILKTQRQRSVRAFGAG
jgi:hypothetical protein